MAAAADNLIGLRDRALLLMGFAAALRRSELVGLDLADLTYSSAGLRLRIRGSKTDQERQGATVAVAPGSSTYCVDHQLVRTGALCRKASSSICLTRKSATSAREMNPHVQSRGSTNAR